MDRRTSTFAAGLWVVRLDQIYKCLPRHYLIHVDQELLLLGALFGGRLLLIGEAKLLAAHHLSPGVNLCPYSRAMSLQLPVSP
jgi:hypothetical protein